MIGLKRLRGLYLEDVTQIMNRTNDELLEDYINSIGEQKQWIFNELLKQNTSFIKRVISGMFGGILTLCNQRKITYADLFSAGTLGFYKAVSQFKDGKWYGNYAAMCIKNEVLMSLRYTKHSPQQSSLDQEVDEAEGIRLKDTIEGEFKEFDAIIDSECIDTALVKLKRFVSARDYNMFVHHYVHELKQEDVGRIFKVDRSLISKVIKRVTIVARRISS